MLRSLLAAFILSICTCMASAQASAPPQHQHLVANTNAIDGAVNPELIADSTAYRLCLFAWSTAKNPSSDALRHQQVQVAQTGLDSNDQVTFVSILYDFRTKYDAAITAYNDSAKAALARNETTDVHPLLQTLDSLVQSTRGAINLQLSPAGAVRLHSFVVGEKKNMKVQED